MFKRQPGASGLVGGQGYRLQEVCMSSSTGPSGCFAWLWCEMIFTLPGVECDQESERIKNCPSVAVTLDGLNQQPELPGMLQASNIRQILQDTLAILVWHAVFSSLWNTFKALKDMPAGIPGFFSQVMQPQVPIFISLTSVLLVCLVNMLHLSEEFWLLTGQVSFFSPL